jgi:hypothetical protein
MGLMQGYSEATSASIPSFERSLRGVIDSANFKNGEFPLKGYDLDFGSGKISPHDADNVLSITRIKDSTHSSKGPTIVTKDPAIRGIDDGEVQALRALKNRGFKTSNIYYENVPASSAQRAKTFKLFNEVLDEGGKIHLTPRTDTINAIPDELKVPDSVYKKMFQQASKEADNIADDLASTVSGTVTKQGYKSFVPKNSLGTGGGYKNVFSYTVTKSGATSLDDGVSAAASTAKSTASSAMRGLRYAVVPLVIVGIALDVIDLRKAYKKDQEEGGYRNTVTTSGRIAGAWAGGLAGAKVGAVAGAAVGAFFGGVGAGPGALIGGVIGGIAGAIGGALAGEHIASEAYDIAEGGSSVPMTRTPIHETISTEYDYSIPITVPGGFAPDEFIAPSVPSEEFFIPSINRPPMHETISYEVSMDVK